MSLNTGDIIEGKYQLEERVLAGGNGQPSRWLADDIKAYRRSEVVIDTIPADYLPDLHWKADLPGMKLAGQLADRNCRYIVWEKDQAPPPIAKYEFAQLSDATRHRLVNLIDAIPVAAHESLLAKTLPEFWHYGPHGTMLFYRKGVTSGSSTQSPQKVKEDWKQAILVAKSTQVECSPETLPENSSSLKWPFLLSMIGLLLAVGVYSLRSQPGTLAANSQSANRLKTFTNAFDRGVNYAEKAAYLDAVQSFEAAVREAPASETIDARLDSLARAYSAYAQAECTRFQSTGSTELYFIPNQYYHYAAILSRNPTIDVCN